MQSWQFLKTPLFKELGLKSKGSLFEKTYLNEGNDLKIYYHRNNLFYIRKVPQFGIININCKVEMESKLKVVPHSKFFKTPTTAQLHEINYLEHILEAYCRQSSHPQKKKKIILMDSYFVLCELRGQNYEPTLIRELNDHLRFQRITQVSETESKTPQVHGFSLISEKGKKTCFHFQFPNLAQLWVNYLAKVMIEVGFHAQYQVLGKIGAGSTASVCSVRRRKDGQIFAAKVFPKLFLQKDERKQSLYNQIELLRALEHPNILKIYSVLQSDTSLYVITQQLNGGNLLERINFSHGISLEQTKSVMKGLIEGLAYLHKFGVMHRDIKLQNVMLRSLEGWEPVFIDFGLAAVSEDEPYIHYRCGTPGYIAPQIIGMRGQKHIEVSCDIFSLGSLFHVLLMNEYLFSGKNSQEIYEKNKTLQFNLSEEKYKNVDSNAMELLLAMLELDHSCRITAEECREQLFLSDVCQSKEKEEVSPAATEADTFDTYLF